MGNDFFAYLFQAMGFVVAICIVLASIACVVSFFYYWKQSCEHIEEMLEEIKYMLGGDRENE